MCKVCSFHFSGLPVSTQDSVAFCIPGLLYFQISWRVPIAACHLPRSSFSGNEVVAVAPFDLGGDSYVACHGRLVNQEDPMASSPHFLQEVMVSTYERRRFQTDIINDMPLYPTEAILWDENQVPSVHYTGTASLPDPASSLCLLACSQTMGARDSSHGLNRLSCQTQPCSLSGLLPTEDLSNTFSLSALCASCFLFVLS